MAELPHCTVLLQLHKSEQTTSPSLQKEAQRTPWMAQMVQNIVSEFTAELASQSAQLQALRSDAALTDATSKVGGYALPALRAGPMLALPQLPSGGLRHRQS